MSNYSPDALELPSARPEPVLDAAKASAATSGVLTGVLTVLAMLGYLQADDISTVQTAGIAVAGAVVALVNVVTPLVRARIARAQVTPVSDPRSADGEPLVAIG